MKKYFNQNYRRFIFLLLFFILINIVSSLPGNLCFESPCICGSACNYGYEINNGFNTIDSCQDGPEYTYEYVHDINISNLNFSYFRGGDIIKIDAYVDCDPDGDEITFVYHNGSSWVPFYNANCNVNGKTHIITTKTLDNFEGTHTIRITLAYNGISNMICAYNHDSLYSDTDDISFYVYDKNKDLEKPKVNIISPENSITYFYENNLIINISVNISDNIKVQNASALITWGSKNMTLDLINSSGIFKANFTNTSDFAKYNLTIIAYDNSSNVNNTESIIFFINKTKDIKIITPTENKLYPYKDFNIEYIIDNNETNIYYSWVELNSGLASFDGNNKKISVEEQSDDSVNCYEINNISQSFQLEKDTYLSQLEIMLKKSGNPDNAKLDIKSDLNNEVLATGIIDLNSVNQEFNWVVIDLNEKIKLNKSTKYWLFLNTTESNIDSENYYEWMLTSNIYQNGSYINNVSKDLLFIIYDYYSFNLTASPLSSVMDLIVYAETDQGQLSSNLITFYLDDNSPVINEYNFTPNNYKDIDPGTTINFTVNATDNLEISNVYLIYRLNDFNWIEKIMDYSNGIYKTNLTLNQTNLTFFFRAFDTSNNLVETSDTKIECDYENNWYIEPSKINTTSGLIGKNKSLGMINIYLDSDYDLDINVSYISNLSILLNGSDSLLLKIPSNKNSSFELVILSSNKTSRDNVILNFNSLNDSNPKNNQLNFTYVSLLSGPYLFLEIIDYYPVVYQGEYLANLKAKLINLGNETAYNITINWLLPEGIIPKRNSTQKFSELQPGGISYIVSQISAQVSETASLGVKELKVIANASDSFGNYSDETIKYIEIKSNQQPIISYSSGQGSKSADTYIPTIIKNEDNLNINLNKLEIKKLIPYTTNITFINNISNKDYIVEIEIEGLFKAYYNLSDYLFYIPKNKEKKINLTINLPSYYELGIKKYKLIVNLYDINSLYDINYSYDLINTNETDEIKNKLKTFDKNKFSLLKQIKKEFDIIVLDNDEKIYCLNNASEKINLLDIDKTDINQKYHQAEINFKNQEYDLVLEFCDYLNNFIDKYEKTRNSLDYLKNEISQLKKEGYKTEEIENYYLLINETIYKGNLEKANELLEKTNLLKSNLEQPAQIKITNFIIKNKNSLIITAIFLPIFILSLSRLIYLTKTETKLKNLEKEKQKLLELLKKMQDYYYDKHFLSSDLYKISIHKIRFRLGQIEISLLKLRNKLKNTNLTKNDIENLIKEIQEDYYIKKIISEQTYEDLIKYYYKQLNDLEQKNKLEQKNNLINKTIEKIDNKKIRLKLTSTNNSILYSKKSNKYDNKEQIKTIHPSKYEKKEASLNNNTKKNEINEKEEKNHFLNNTLYNINETTKQNSKNNKSELNLDNIKDNIEVNIDFYKRCEKNKAFILNNGLKLYSIFDLYEKLVFNLIDNQTFEYHVNQYKNDFSTWISDVYNYNKLAKEVKKINSKEQLIDFFKKIIEYNKK
ncbi:MAG: hypothetical protein QXE31_02010 [Candidatus Woesearchaeota archaeon]